MKFDCVLGNPPYQHPTKKSGQSLWPLFVRLSIELTRQHVVLIIPIRWCAHSCNIMKGRVKLFNSFMKGHLTFANLAECSKYFTAGFTSRYFSYFGLDITKQNFETKFITLEQPQPFVFNIKNLNQIPQHYATPLSFSIASKVDQYIKQHSTFKEFQQIIKYKSNGNRRLIVGTGRFVSYKDMEISLDTGNLTHTYPVKSTCFGLKITDDVSTSNIHSVFRSKLFMFLGFIYDTKDVYGPSYFKALPYMDLTKKWADEEIYTLFKLTTAERQLIEEKING